MFGFLLKIKFIWHFSRQQYFLAWQLSELSSKISVLKQESLDEYEKADSDNGKERLPESTVLNIFSKLEGQQVPISTVDN
ncbi:unnamed protein product, partial [Rotaria magnacalcarata]